VAAEPASNGLANAAVADDAANAVAESHWDTSNHDNSISQEWVDVTHPVESTEGSAEPSAEAPAEAPAETPAEPATEAKKQSWADDHPDPVTEVCVMSR
jgi:hypothetical protein